ncbi:MAG: peptidyl-prolyl cis-trans isomerase, partial [Neisseriaceae bacterium]|nr:peptidyl-prolyl cis-trans isomerase [Neisseriaceae bacterium]
MLPPEFAQVIDGMDKGKISTKAVEFQGQLYLIKVADTRKGDKMPPFPQVRDRLLAQYKDKLVREKVEKLFAEHGLSVAN